MYAIRSYYAPELQYSYVNGRMMRDKLINHAIRQACVEALGVELAPAYVLYLELDPRQVDVNVHPAKHEVRFHEARLVHDFLLQVLREALRSVRPGVAESVITSYSIHYTKLYEVAAKAPAPLLPAQILPLAYRIGAVVFGDAPLHLQVTQLGIGMQVAVDEDCRTQPCAYGDHHHHPLLVLTHAETHLRQAGGIGVVQQVAGAATGLAEQGLGIHIDPAGIYVGGGEHHAMVDGGRKAAADRTLPGEVCHQGLEA